MRAVADVGTQLARAIEAGARAQQCTVAAESVTTTRWASATFSGARHRLHLAAAPSAAFDQWLAGLGECEFALRGHLVADLVTQAIRRTGAAVEIDVEVLTLEDC